MALSTKCAIISQRRLMDEILMLGGLDLRLTLLKMVSIIHDVVLNGDCVQGGSEE